MPINVFPKQGGYLTISSSLVPFYLHKTLPKINLLAENTFLSSFKRDQLSVYGKGQADE